MREDIRPTTFAEITPEMIAQWKAKHKLGIFKLSVVDQEIGEEEVPDPEKPHKTIKVKKYSYKSGFIRQPDRMVLKVSMTMAQNGGQLAMLESVLEEVWLGGDEELLNDDNFFLGAIDQIQQLLQVKTSALEKC